MLPKDMLDALTPVLGLAGWNTAAKMALAKREIYNGAAMLWNHRIWNWRDVSDWPVVTTANQSYVLLPDNYGGQYSVNGQLYFKGEPRGTGPKHRSKLDFQEELQRWGTSAGKPLFCTVRARNTGTDAAPIYTAAVLDFTPTPDNVYTLYGFHYGRAMDEFSTWAWDGTDAAVFPYTEYDFLWKQAALSNLCALAPAIATKAEEQIDEAKYEALLAQCVDAWAPEELNQLQTDAGDHYHDLDDLQSQWGM